MRVDVNNRARPEKNGSLHDDPWSTSQPTAANLDQHRVPCVRAIHTRCGSRS